MNGRRTRILQRVILVAMMALAVLSSGRRATPVLARPDPGQAAFAAVQRITGGLPEPACFAARVACLLPSASSNPESVAHGIAAFSLGDCDETGECHGGAIVVLGRDAAGEWGYWFGGQQYYAPIILPSRGAVCANGDSLNLRAAPSTDAPVLSTLPEGTAVRLEEFILTEAGSFPDRRGDGWYRTSDGWVSARYIAGPPLTDCTYPNQFLQS